MKAQRLFRSPVVKAHVWTAAVVIVNAGRQQGHDISDTPECQVGQQLVLDRRVDPFRPGVVLWIAILGHADEDAVALQYVDI